MGTQSQGSHIRSDHPVPPLPLEDKKKPIQDEEAIVVRTRLQNPPRPSLAGAFKDCRIATRSSDTFSPTMGQEGRRQGHI